MQEELIKKGQQFVANTYNRYPIVITKGEGCWVWDMNGRRYLDFLAGIAVCNLGHARPDIADAIAAQARKLVHISNLFYMEPQIKAAEFLVGHSFGDKVFFCNSGAEANEAAIKLARRYSWKKYGAERHEIIVMENSFHGRTLASLTATGQSKFHEGFAPLVGGFSYVPFNDFETLSRRITDRTCAVMLELIQAEGGIYVADKAYAEALRKLADERDLILIIDEVQTGIGRTGKLFAYEHYGIKPDVMTLAKALGNGFPIGAMVATENAMKALDPGTHASTFGGNPLATTALMATLNAIVDEGIVKNCEETGRYLHRKLLALKQKYPFIAEVRGMGLLLGVELTIDADAIQREFMQEGVIINSMKGKVLRLVPPLVAKKEEVDIFMDVADRILGRQKC